MSEPIVLVDDARSEPSAAYCFLRPTSILAAERSGEIEAAFRGLQEALSRGKYVAGYFAYELGYLLEQRLAPLAPNTCLTPLLWFGVFDAPEILGCDRLKKFLEQNSIGRAYAGPLLHEWTEPEYMARFRRVHALIGAGDIYQANLSFRSRFSCLGDPLALYGALRERAAAANCAYVDDGTRQILSLSPELFFSISADGRIVAKPMKGTVARGSDPASDAAARAHLPASDKERAENLMIVDLVRNDLGRIAEPGTVTVEELFAVESYPTVHQMVSTVTAKLAHNAGLGEIVCALFPCGSVTGAPKIRAMEIIRELESSPRGLYCGAIGYFAPDGSAKFNVAIRTLTISGSRGELGVGGAIVYDSQAHSEHAECLLKARYFEAARTPIELIETLLWSPSEGFIRLERHLARMESSAATFGIQFNRDGALVTLWNAVNAYDDPVRVRLALAEDGKFSSGAAPLSPPPPRWRFAISPVRVSSGDALLRHKTNWREIFEREHARAAALGCDEAVFLNERGEVTQGSRTNVFVRKGGQLLTPPLACGLLNGCLRQELIESGEVSEGILSPDDLAQGTGVYLGNSLRGLVRAQSQFS